MASWREVEQSEPAFAEQVQARFDAHKHKTLATLRKDGAPRISGIEATFGDGDVWLGSMPGALKARDLQRDPRFALHSASVDPPDDDPAGWSGDAKVSGRAIEVLDPDERARVSAVMNAGGEGAGDIPIFRLDITEVVLTRVGVPADHLRIELWTPKEGLHTFRR